MEPAKPSEGDLLAYHPIKGAVVVAMSRIGTHLGPELIGQGVGT